MAAQVITGNNAGMTGNGSGSYPRRESGSLLEPGTIAESDKMVVRPAAQPTAVPAQQQKPNILFIFVSCSFTYQIYQAAWCCRSDHETGLVIPGRASCLADP